MDSGIELMSENSTMDGSFPTDTWEYMRVRRKVEGERQKRAARDRKNVEDWKIRGRRGGGGEGEISQRTYAAVAAIEQRKEGERISVEVELHNLNLDDLKKIERKKEVQEKVQETALKGIKYLIEAYFLKRSVNFCHFFSQAIRKIYLFSTLVYGFAHYIYLFVMKCLSTKT